MITLPPDPTAYSRALATLWNEIAAIGRNPDTGGYRRFAWTDEDHLLREWFAGAAAARGLEVTLDRAGNQWAWWGDPDAAAIAGRPGLVVGSHLDSVPDGGAYDGPLGVVSSLAAVEVLRAEGFRPERDRSAWSTSATRRARGSASPAPAPGCSPARSTPTGPGRCATPTAGRWPRAWRPPASTRSRSARTPLRCNGSGRSSSCTSSRAAVWSTSARPSAWPARSGRTAAGGSTSPGEANHAGTTRLADRHDPMLAYAGAVLAAREAAAAARGARDLRQGPRRPRTASTRSRRRSPRWLDARGPSGRGRARAGGGPGGDRRAAGASVREESWTDETSFDTRLRSRLSALLAGPGRHRGAGPGHRRRSRRGHPVPGRGGDRDALRPQPDRHLALPGGVRRGGRLRQRRRGAGQRDPGARLVTAYWCELAWLADAPAASVRIVVGDDRRISAVEAGQRRRTATTGWPASSCRVSPTPTRTRSTGRCAAARTPTAAPSGPGARGCTPSRDSWIRTPT